MNKSNFGIAVKAFIISDDSILLIKRSLKDKHKPGVWEVPGGRLNELSEDPILGLKREVKEEIGLNIEVISPIRVHSFTRDDNQKITMISFLCKPLNSEIILSTEHSEAKWVSKKEVKTLLVSDFHENIDVINKYFS